jgi:hypothetical protein
MRKSTDHQLKLAVAATDRSSAYHQHWPLLALYFEITVIMALFEKAAEACSSDSFNRCMVIFATHMDTLSLIYTELQSKDCDSV